MKCESRANRGPKRKRPSSMRPIRRLNQIRSSTLVTSTSLTRGTGQTRWLQRVENHRSAWPPDGPLNDQFGEDQFGAANHGGVPVE
jgi:hypothetical protein